MSGEPGLQAAIYVSLATLVAASILFGFRPLTSRPVFNENDVEALNHTRDLNPGGAARGGFFMILVNGASDGLFVATTAFNAVYPILNLLLQASSLSWQSLQPRAAHLAISLLASYLTIANMRRLASLRDREEAQGMPGSRTRLFILRQYLAYNVSLILCWIMAADGLVPRIVAFALIWIAFTADDWNLIAKYLDVLSLPQLRRAEILKGFGVLTLVPALSVSVFAIPAERQFLIGLAPQNGIAMVAVIAVLTLIVQWTLQLAASVRLARSATRW